MSQKELFAELLARVPEAKLIADPAEITSLLPPEDAPWGPQLDALRGVAKRWGWKLEESDDPTALVGEPAGESRGMTFWPKQAIWVKSPQPDSWKLYVLAHELGHVVSGLWMKDIRDKFDAELFAEATGYLVLKSMIPEWDNPVAPAYILNLLLASVERGTPAFANPHSIIAGADTILASVNSQSALSAAA